ncbi:crossover junction endonuclease EME1 isoform X2 [Acyrthosiphon pisum]|uniref:Crossover junction endonuclease EME1 n=1 Tax=Acyrthosiphon pisum TaxID=7029 RepID=A0A8R2B6Y9_ACYPI|nr:crossover junction endonuclease EME1 isoform X2 [Acyrthosiphon pisum]|eukprot:XP_008184545.1 PREDICTED: crossover junction endonuclease EME1 isoform X2 [Acyrthosiphon pisum]
MDEGCYNTYTISDSDDSVKNEDRRTKYETSRKDDDCLSSEEEPDFFNQVLQCQKRKKLISPEIELHHRDDNKQKDVQANKNHVSIFVEDPEPRTEPCIYNDTNNEQPTEKIEPKRKKRSTKEEIEERKKEEKARKDAKKRLAEELKRINPKECMKYVTVHIDINLLNHEYGEQLISEIESSDAKYKIESNSTVLNSITWSRQKSDTISEDENFMLIIWEFDYVKNLIVSYQLLNKINDIKLHKTQLSIIIYSTADQLKKTKSKKNGKNSGPDMLNSLEQMMLSCQVSFRFVENKNDIGLAVFYLTKSIAQKPYKLNKYKEEQEGCDWYASGHTKNCVTVDKNGTGLTQLWRQMLSQFPLCGLETSEAIATAYGSPIALLEAYDNCSSRLEGETLLQDIAVRRGFGPLASNRRIGPELSKKIYTFFSDNTGCTTLSQE